jgi:hypothetical protein
VLLLLLLLPLPLPLLPLSIINNFITGEDQRESKCWVKLSLPLKTMQRALRCTRSQLLTLSVSVDKDEENAGHKTSSTTFSLFLAATVEISKAREIAALLPPPASPASKASRQRPPSRGRMYSHAFSMLNTLEYIFHFQRPGYILIKKRRTFESHLAILHMCTQSHSTVLLLNSVFFTQMQTRSLLFAKRD